MIPGDYNLTIYRGRAERWRMQLFQDSPPTRPVDLTGCTPVAGIGRLAGKIDLECTVVVEDGITAEDGWVEVAISAEDSALLTGTLYPWTAGILDSQEDWNPCLQGDVHVLTDDSL